MWLTDHRHFMHIMSLLLFFVTPLITMYSFKYATKKKLPFGRAVVISLLVLISCYALRTVFLFAGINLKVTEWASLLIALVIQVVGIKKMTNASLGDSCLTVVIFVLVSGAISFLIAAFSALALYVIQKL